MVVNHSHSKEFLEKVVEICPWLIFASHEDLIKVASIMWDLIPKIYTMEKKND